VVTLTCQSCKALVSHALLMDFNLCAEEIPEYSGCGDKFVWPNTLPDDWEVTWEPIP
jgi:hypothetical protein